MSNFYLTEMFSAIQGEGPIVGTRQIFVRFLGCHIKCAFCDTPATHTKQRQFRVEITPGKRDFKIVNNPLSRDDFLGYFHGLRKNGIHHSLSFTGGEPLQHVKQILSVVDEIKKYMPVYIETDGILHENLAQVIDKIDIVSMDMKLPSSTMLQSFWDDHRKFLTIAKQKEVFIKLVVTANTSDEEINIAAEIVGDESPEALLIIQPVTPYGMIRNIPTPDQLLHFQSQAQLKVKNVRVIPQTHKITGQI